MSDNDTPRNDAENAGGNPDDVGFRAGRHALPDDAPPQTGPIPIVGDTPPVQSDQVWTAPPGGRHEVTAASSHTDRPTPDPAPASLSKPATGTGGGTAVIDRPRADTPPAAPRKRSEGKTAERRLAFWLVAPAALMMLLVTGYPIVYAVWLSLNKMSLSAPGEREFVWFANYATVLTDNYWWTAFAVTVGITVVSVLIELVLGMAIALVMHRTIFGRGTIRTVVLIPYGIVTVAAAFSWYYAWTPGTGYLANLLPDGTAPLTEQWPSLAIIVLAEVWKTTPFMALLLLAGLALVPDDLLKAAQVDGAGAWTRLWRIILPLMKPAILVALLFRTLDAFRVFDNIYVLTSGSNNTYSVSMLGYDNLFGAFNLGVGSAISILIFICVAIIAFVFIKGFGTAAPGSDDEGR